MGMYKRYAMSEMLKNGSECFADLSDGKNKLDHAGPTQYNMAAILLAYTSIEAVLNEIISYGDLNKQFKVPNEYLIFLKTMERRTNINEKYNLLATILGKELWDKSKEPFQSFQTLQYLRNYIIHYKGDFTKEDKIPDKIHNLYNELKISIPSKKTWFGELIQNKKIGRWAYNTTKNLYNNINTELYSELNQKYPPPNNSPS